ncbi:uncharacterized protein LOC127794966 [Diospyros lotus]|uniref:uncharacterized protein LOC127794966 n=1 Tax=Diospyros lotus TaxID=55363 RepID=UPI00225657D4|nr:uncharacterized protein LOC127794966 [Diospyros lotus]
MSARRPRKIAPSSTVESESPYLNALNTLGKIQEPSTPPKTLESPPKPSPVSSSPTPPTTASARRRSLRLASKVSPNGTNPMVVENFVGNEIGGEDVGVKEARVESDRHLNEVVNKVESPPDLGSTGSVASGGRGRGKRKLSGAVGFGGEMGEEECLNLRSGKKIPKRRVEGEGSRGSEKGDDDKASVLVLTLGNVNGDLMNEPLVISDGDMEDTVETELSLTLGRNAGVDLNLIPDFRVQEVEKNPRDEEEDTGVEARRRTSGKEKMLLDFDMQTSPSNAVLDTDNLAESDGPEELGKEQTASGSRRLSEEEKGKGKVVEDVSLENVDSAARILLDLISDLDRRVGDSRNVADSGSLGLEDDAPVHTERQVVENNLERQVEYNRWVTLSARDRFKDIARQNAARFALFCSQEEQENHVADESVRGMARQVNREIEDWPGPFSTAMKIIKDRKSNVNLLQQSSRLGNPKPTSIVWAPKNEPHYDRSKVPVPSLQDLSMSVLVKNADALTSLDGVPDVLRHKLCQLLCDSRRMNRHFLDLLFCGSPTEIRMRDCSWLTEAEFESAFKQCETKNLTVLQLEQCGRCLPDYILSTTLARSPNAFPALTTISLKGACRLSDVGLGALVASMPTLQSINLSQCSLLTSDGINTLSNSLGSALRELYLDDCQCIDPMLIVPALSKLVHLEVLSLARIETVCDDFISNFIAFRGHNIKELVLTDCVKLTDSSLKVIAETCTKLHALDLGNLCRLTDSTMAYLANGCRAIQTLKLCRNRFSDDAVAAYLEASAETLCELSLNCVKKVADNTAISLARRARKLTSLDLSWCRNLTNEALGLILDSCLSLKVLKLFGCTQVTKELLDGHSNPQVQIIGLKMTPILKHLKVPNPLQGPLHYSYPS